MATSAFSTNDDNDNGEIGWPLEYVAETKECICGWCGQLLVPSHTSDDLKKHFKRCKNFKNIGLLQVFKEVRKVSQNFKALSADISDIKKEVDSMKSEVKELKADVLKIKTELNNEKEKVEGNTDGVLLTTLFNKVSVLEKVTQEKMRAMGVAQEIKLAEVNGRVSGVTETISTIVQSVLEVKGKAVTSSADTVLANELDRMKKETEALWVQLKKNEGDHQTTKTQLEGDVARLKAGMETVNRNVHDLRLVQTQLEVELAKNEAEKQLAEEKKKKKFHVEPSPLDQLTIIFTMNCFNLITHNYLFQPSYRWTIDNIESITAQKTFELSSEMFQWNGYPVQARAKFQLREDDCVYVSLRLRYASREENEAKDFRPFPQVFYLLKDKDARSPRHKCRSQFYLLNAVFSDLLKFDRCLVHKSWFNDSAYNVKDSVEIEIYVEPSPMAQLVYSYDGTLEWNVENYSRRLQLEKDSLVYDQESPYFYTGPDGYRVQVRICLNAVAAGGPTVQIIFLTGKFDAELPQSFPHSTTFTLINRKEAERSLKKTIVEDIENNKYYKFEICKLEEVVEFIENDTLYCNVIIKSL